MSDVRVDVGHRSHSSMAGSEHPIRRQEVGGVPPKEFAAGIREIVHSRTGAVIAGATVLVTLGGVGGAVAVGQITSSDIKNQTIQSWDIAKGGVGSSEIRKGSVGWYGELNQFTRNKIKSLAGQDGADGSDGADGTDGAEGAAGPAGAQGPQGQTGATGPAGTVAYGLTNWSIVDRNVEGNGASYLRAGPTGSGHSGEGSLGLRTGAASDRAAFGNQVDFQGDVVNDLTAVGFSVFTTSENQDPDPGNMPGITLEIDPNLAASTSNYSSLVFVPAPIVAGQWVTIDATAVDKGVWFLTGDAGTATGCTAAAPCSFAVVQTALEDGGAEAVVTFGVTVKVASTNPFSGAVDDLIINTQTFDFEPFGVSVS